MLLPDDVNTTTTKADVKRLKSEASGADFGLDEAYKQGREDAAADAGEEAANVKVRGSKLSFSNDAQKIIVITMTITGLVAIIENLNTGENLRRTNVSTIIVGTFISGGLLLGMSYALPEFASGLSIVAMLATVLDRGKPFWMAIETVSKNTPVISGGGPAKTGSKSGDLSSAGTLPDGSRPLSPTGNSPRLPDLSSSGGPLPGPGQKPGSNPYANIPGISI